MLNAETGPDFSFSVQCSSFSVAPLMIFLRPVTIFGTRAAAFLEFLGGLGYLLRDTVFAVPRGLLNARGRRLAWRNLWAQMVRVGVRSVPIVMLVLFCIGAILALQMAPVLKNYGALSQ